MPDYHLFDIYNNEEELPELYLDDDSETNTDQILNYLVNNYKINYYDISLKLKRNGIIKNVTNTIEIIDGDILYYELVNIYTYNFNCIKSFVNSISLYINDKDFLNELNSLSINKFSINFYNDLPMSTFKYKNDNYIYFGKYDNQDNLYGFGILFNLTKNIYYQGFFNRFNIYYGVKIDRYNVILCDVFEKLVPNNCYGKVYSYGNYMYFGFLEKGLRNKFGKMVYLNGNIYVGSWKNDIRNEFGILYIKRDNLYYIGMFSDDNPTYNKDEYILSKEKIEINDIIGNVEQSLETDNNKILINSNKSIYNKTKLIKKSINNKRIENNKEELNNYKYIGQFNENNNLNGVGILQYCDNEYQSLFNNDLPEIFGYIKFNNGYKYIGNIKNGVMHGSGKLTDIQGNVLHGIWNEGKIII